MRPARLLSLVASILAASVWLPWPAFGAEQALPRGETQAGRSRAAAYVPGEILVKFRDPADAEEVATRGDAAAARRPGLTSVFKRFEMSARRRPFARSRSARLASVVKLVSEQLRRHPDQVAVILDALRRRPEVEYAHLNAIVEAQWTPDDPYLFSSGGWGQSFPDLWGLEKINAPNAWDLARGADVTVAVVDTGIDSNHPDLAANLWWNQGEVGTDANGQDKRTNGIDDDDNGYVDDSWGWDFARAVTGDNNPTDDCGHGTHVAGTIAAVADNGLGIAGVAPLAKVMAVKILDSNGRGTTEDVSRGIVYAADNGARVINLSLGASGETPPMLVDAIAYAHDTKGVVVVAAAGNDSAEVGTPLRGFFPANLRDAITVAAFDQNDVKSSFSNYGAKIDVAAPGGGGTEPAGVYEPQRTILSLKATGATDAQTRSGQLVVGSQYLRQAGTSMAAPHVSGVAALLRSHSPALSPEQVRQAIRVGAVDLGPAGFDAESGYGRLDGAAALAAATPLAVQLTDPVASVPVSANPLVRGTAAGPDFSDWNLEYGSGTTPTVWMTVATSTTAVTHGVLAEWDVAGLADGPYTLRLQAHNAAGETFEDRLAVAIDSVAITSPAAASARRGGETISITGTVAPSSLASYAFRIVGRRTGLLSDPRITLVNDGRQSVVNGLLGTWDTTGVPPDHYRLCVIVRSAAYTEECTNLIVDPALHPGWPQNLGADRHGGLTASIVDHLIAADLNGDGQEELVIGYSDTVRVLDHSGVSLPGWPQTVDPTLAGASVQHGPAVGDVNGDGLPEVVARNNAGAIFVWRGDGTLLPGWPQYTTRALGRVTLADVTGDGIAEIIACDYMIHVFDGSGATLPGWPDGLGPGHIAVGDVDGDGANEIVFASEQGPGDLWVFRGDGRTGPPWPINVNPTAPWYQMAPTSPSWPIWTVTAGKRSWSIPTAEECWHFGTTALPCQAGLGTLRLRPSIPLRWATWTETGCPTSWPAMIGCLAVTARRTTSLHGPRTARPCRAGRESSTARRGSTAPSSDLARPRWSTSTLTVAPKWSCRAT